ncbi:Uncharacterized protein Adt_48800 [Abeliophyllum distichum]|uniref:Uncharacterized protein n=1 Tax=Abeliophyllum distichum TaxID=126358 RepID=A0ABD1NRY0_9LAMI
MVRLVFRPYTQVRRTICTSVSLRASTRVSSGFAPLRHSSPSFGSRQVCSHSNPSQKIKVGRRCTPQGDHANQLPCALRFTRPLTRTHVRLLGPCFKTGRMGSPQASTGSTQMPKHAWEARAVRHNRDDGIPQAYRLPGLWPPPQFVLVHAPSQSADRLIAVPHPTGRIADPHPFPPDNFKHSLTLFQSSFHLSLAVLVAIGLSRLYLALDGIYRPIGAAFPNNPTRRQAPRGAAGSEHNGALTLSGAPFQGTWARPPLRTLLQTTIRTAKPHDFQVGLFPVRSPLLGNPCKFLFLRLLICLNSAGNPS